MKRHALLVSLCVGLAVPLSAWTISGSRTMHDLNVALTAQYQSIHPGAKFTAADDGTTKGIEKVIDGTADIAAVTRQLRPNEIDSMRKTARAEGVFIPVAREGISIYLHPQNRVESLTVDQIAAIYAGKITNWRQLGGADLPIRVYAFDLTTGRYWYVAEEVMKKEKFGPAVTYTTEKVAGAKSEAAALEQKAAQMLKWVSSDPGAIGFGSLKKIRVVKMAKVSRGGPAYWPTPADVASGNYPLQRTLGYVVRTAPKGELKDFIDWVLQQGETIRAFGFVPVK